MSQAQRKCNVLETIFAQANITVGACVGFERPFQTHVVQRAIKGCLDASICGCTKVSGVGGTDACILSLRKPGERVVRTICYPAGANISEAFQKLLDMPNSFSPATVDAVVLVEPGNNNNCRGVCFNGNHCLWDGKSIVNIIETFASLLSQANEGELKDVTLPSKICYEWGQLLKDNIGTPLATPAYLPIDFENPGSIVTMKDIQVCFNEEKKDNYGVCDVRIDFEPELFKGILGLLRRKQSGSLTGLLTVCLQQALGEICLSPKSEGPNRFGTSCNIATRILVDLRQALGNDVGRDNHISQCFGNVIVGNTIKLLNDTDGPNILLELSKSTTLALRSRIARGEANAASLISSEGNFNDGQTDHATFEISNFGIYDVGEDTVVYHTQRYEGYDGVSILTHSEKIKGVFRLGASLMGPINPKLIATALRRTKELFHVLLAKENREPQLN
jgi:hypothetical protein